MDEEILRIGERKKQLSEALLSDASLVRKSDDTVLTHCLDLFMYYANSHVCYGREKSARFCNGRFSLDSMETRRDRVSFV